MCGRTWIATRLVCTTQVLVAFVKNIAIEDLFDLRLSGRLVRDCMKSNSSNSFVSAETETEVESTSAISSQVQSHAQNLNKELWRHEKNLCSLNNLLAAITGIWRPDMVR